MSVPQHDRSATEAGAGEAERGENFVVIRGDPSVTLLFTCEHAGNAVPPAYSSLGLSAAELETHWAYDPGVLGVFLAARAEARCTSVHSLLTRLLCDLNRAPTSPQLSRPTIGTGFDADPFRPVPGNQDLTAKERLHRLRAYYRPFHAVLDRAGDELVAVSGEHVLVVSFHSFTPTFGNEDRAFEVGVLFDDDGRPARTLQELLAAQGLRVRLNEPYSGLRGENFSPRIHAHTLGCRHIELELNQGYIRSPDVQQALGVTIATALRHLLTHG